MTTTAPPTSSTYQDAVVANIRSELARVGCTQQQLADVLDQHRSWVAGRLGPRNAKWAIDLTLDDVERIAAAIGCSIDDLTKQARS